MDAVDRLEAALRVLSAITSRKEPDPLDRKILQENADPFDPELPIDELARCLVELEVQKRSDARSRRKPEFRFAGSSRPVRASG